MSTAYFVTHHRPKLDKLVEFSGATVVDKTDATAILRRGRNHLHVDLTKAGRVRMFVRYGGNDPAWLLNALADMGAVVRDEYEMYSFGGQ